MKDTCAQDHRRRVAGTVLEDDIYFVAISSDRAFAAFLIAEHEQVIVTYNRRFVHASTLGLVELWARHAFATGWLVAMLPVAALGGLG